MSDPDYFSTIPTYKFALRDDLSGEDMFIPTRGEDKATGWDVRAAFRDRNPLVIRPLQQVKIPLGIRGFCPEGWWYEIRPRSSSFAKKNMHALYGVVDETYEGELIFACQYIPPFHHSNLRETHELDLLHYFDDNSLTIEFGDAIAQIIPVRRQDMRVEKITEQELEAEYHNRNGKRGAGGFGSTGK